MNGQNRKDILPGLEVDIVLKADQKTGKLTRGIVKDILTKSVTHPPRYQSQANRWTGRTRTGNTF